MMNFNYQIITLSNYHISDVPGYIKPLPIGADRSDELSIMKKIFKTQNISYVSYR